MDTSISIIVIVRGGKTLNMNNVCRILTGDIKLNDSHVDITRPLRLVIREGVKKSIFFRKKS